MQKNNLVDKYNVVLLHFIYYRFIDFKINFFNKFAFTSENFEI